MKVCLIIDIVLNYKEASKVIIKNNVVLVSTVILKGSEIPTDLFKKTTINL